MDALKTLGGMLRAEEPRKRIAAAVVLGELKVKDPAIVKALSDMAQDPLDAYAHAALGALTALEGGEKLLALGLAKAKEEVGAQVLSEALLPLVKKLSKKELGKLLAAGEAALSDSVVLARHKLDPVREVDPQAWANVLREKARASL